MLKPYKLPKEFATKWLAALRSGEYIKCESQLVEIDGPSFFCSYCAMGIAGHILGASDTKMKGSMFLTHQIVPDLPLELVSHNRFTDYISDLNDNKGKTFPEIADCIEAVCEFY